jgi:poly(3-hydroxybutyrate) depolymerase
METNLIFAGIMAVAGIWMLIHQRKTSRIIKAQDEAREARVEAWHQANPGHRWPKTDTSTPKKSTDDGQNWFRNHSPADFGG